jgi:hypothetical protein
MNFFNLENILFSCNKIFINENTEGIHLFYV